jgi:methanogenic corrinoid protein MtbC1
VVARVDAALFRRPDLGVLLGDASSSAVRELHRYLAAFLGSVYQIGLPEVLSVGLPRLMAGYRSRGLPDVYFHAMPEVWEQAIADQFGPTAAPLSRVVGWMGAHPESWVPSSTDAQSSTPASEAVERLVVALLSGDGPGATSVMRGARERGLGMEALFVELIQPALYEIGNRWESGRITAAQEHLASALVARILAAMDPEAGTGGRTAVVTTAPTETHEFGAWMVSDVLRSAGWDVRFLGSQLPAEEILHYLRSSQPSLLAVSVTLEIHLPSLASLIRGLRDDPELESLPVLVGGQAFAAGERVWRSAGADAMARDALEVEAAAESLAQGRSGLGELH